MSPETHAQLASFIWSICNLLRGPYKRNEYRKVILPLTVLKRFDSVLAPTKAKALAAFETVKDKSENIVKATLCNVTGVEFYNISKLDFARLLDDPNNIALNLNSYISAFSPNVREIMERFKFGEQVAQMQAKNLLYEVIKSFNTIDLSLQRVDNMQMGYVFEELIRIGAEQANEEAGEHFTPREVIKLMVNLLLTDEGDLTTSHIVKTIYDPACGTGGMLSTAESHIRALNQEASPHLFGQDWNDESYAVCKADMLIKGENADNIRMGDIFTEDRFPHDTFDYMLANPPFGVSWKQQEKAIGKEHESRGYEGRFGAGLPRINDGALLFLQHMLSKMRRPEQGGSRIGIVFNGSPLFTGDAGSGESEIRRWIIENDWLEAVVALPDQLFYNTGIFTYIWVLTNRKMPHRKGKIQLLDARSFFVKMRKSLGNKRNEIADGENGRPDQIAEIVRLYGAFRDGECSRIFANEDFGYAKITVERPLRLNFQASPERLARLEQERGFQALAGSAKKDPAARALEIQAGQARQQAIRDALGRLDPAKLYLDRKQFKKDLKAACAGMSPQLAQAELKPILAALGERDEAAAICMDAKGAPEPDSSLRDTESVPLKESIQDYFRREVLPHVPDAWIDESKTRIGYEIPLTRHFYKYTPPRPLAEIEAEIKTLEREIMAMLGEGAA
ncbi:N-6 DNA methylase [Megalodesulfovibrio gigas]|uniref:site-specific DNA-methyltransferase (adenine-specific) n=1 Tax=Megalodesulfovibrio gigas (strain ATCC 19364 / DSM 1382 / NCIMB 9332 / VKM B-1759) TaxID=1121448 RepID=T2GA51_MEGG1|nr:N-6 DNA methylase [Megalodesulfovibrio gigas]AGW13148.1 putative N-6 DNA methylase [Megalodesulfovibrio gigas DSM 1382 = ATCC 19364]